MYVDVWQSERGNWCSTLVDEINITVDKQRPTVLLRRSRPIPHALGLGHELSLLEEARNRVADGVAARHDLRDQPISFDRSLRILAWAQVREPSARLPLLTEGVDTPLG